MRCPTFLSFFFSLPFLCTPVSPLLQPGAGPVSKARSAEALAHPRPPEEEAPADGMGGGAGAARGL